MYPRGREATLAAVLHTILRDRPSTQKEIAEKVGVSRRYVTELLRPLIEEGAVRRTYTVDMSKLRRHFPELFEELGNFLYEDVEMHLEGVRPYFKRMTDLTLEQIETALIAVEENPEQAPKVIEMDEEVNRLDEEIRLYVRTLPVLHPCEEAGKVATLLLEISHCIERIGDYACNIAEVAETLGTLSDLQCWREVREAALEARSMVKTAYSIFLGRVKEEDLRHEAEKVYCAEDRVHKNIIRACEKAVEETKEFPEKADRLFGLSRITKDIERIADKAVDVVDFTRELVEGRPRDLTPEQEMRSTLPADGTH
ncbi:PhoU domain-containing protein [Methanopyrus kandleri]|uniref:Phosphate uptake regulator n=2 Tax=Methanopyrus kandleri TaxID=2320 RepID=Q8TX17_METKA|nr:PhoU domain-containing protein [Methanopyrus kandleri]AAM02075.1 Phosphate uptake regulator [Methanopyrus kandleri AV19]HII69910.1 winged helix-turn-helix transcriptional regulator [Methanopyrus kandleri]